MPTFFTSLFRMIVRHAEGDAASLMLFRASRSLPISEPKPMTPLQALRWWMHRTLHHVPREQFETQKAHHRGLVIGWYHVKALPPAGSNQNHTDREP